MSDFTEVIKNGSRREQLEAIRDLLAERLLKAFPKDVAPIARELGEVITELEQLTEEEGGSPLDDLLASRQPNANVWPSA